MSLPSRQNVPGTKTTTSLLQVQEKPVELAIFIEGPGSRDKRDPVAIAESICGELQSLHTDLSTINAVVFTQGDSEAATGVSPISYNVAKTLQLPRVMFALDSKHYAMADKRLVADTVMLDTLLALNSDIQPHIDSAIQKRIEAINATNGQQIPEWIFDFARLQETAKTVMKRSASKMTVFHSTANYGPHSVTSFYQIGLELGLYDIKDMKTCKM